MGGLDPRYDKRGAVRFRPDMKSGGGGGGGGGGGAVHFRPDMKSVCVGGGGGAVRGCLAEEREVLFMKGQLYDHRYSTQGLETDVVSTN